MSKMFTALIPILTFPLGMIEKPVSEKKTKLMLPLISE